MEQLLSPLHSLGLDRPLTSLSFLESAVRLVLNSNNPPHRVLIINQGKRWAEAGWQELVSRSEDPFIPTFKEPVSVADLRAAPRGNACPIFS